MKPYPKKLWTADDVLALSREFQGACVLAAAAELNLFSPLANGPLAADALALQLQSDLRGLTVLLDALVALQLLEKRENDYSLAPGIAATLTPGGGQSVLAMAQHQANCLHRWDQLARVVKTGRPAGRHPSLLGEAGDRSAFIGAMDNISAPVADAVIRAVVPLEFTQMLDIGGASGTWTMAFLRACPAATAVLFDLPPVLPMAERRLTMAGLRHRVRLVAGDFENDPLPAGADLAWVSAIVHQNSRKQNRILFAKVFTALAPAGRIAIRDILMDHSRTSPVPGALFAVNMLVGTDGGGTFTFDELKEDLEAAGFTQAAILRRDPAMNSIVVARK
jgi:O-methyltransferase domain/Dimerisation domain